MKLLHLLLFLYATLCSPQANSINESALIAAGRHILQSGGSADAWVHSGNYRIGGCGEGLDSTAGHLTGTIIPNFWKYLQELLSDVRTPSASSGFHAFFKSPANRDKVKAVLGDISAGTNPVFPEGNHLEFRNPALVCITQDNGLVGIFESCQNDPHQWGFKMQNLVLLCPNFFRLPRVWVVNTCPHVVNGVYKPNSNMGLANQYAMFVQIMASMYLDLVVQYLNIQDAVNLNEEDSVMSTSNYGYYASSKPPNLT